MRFFFITDGLPLQIGVLPEIVRAVQGRVEVYLDGGVRLGTDVFKALALGARAVFVGRPALWGLAYQVSYFHIYAWGLHLCNQLAIGRGAQYCPKVTCHLRHDMQMFPVSSLES